MFFFSWIVVTHIYIYIYIGFQFDRLLDKKLLPSARVFCKQFKFFSIRKVYLFSLLIPNQMLTMISRMTNI